MGIPLRVEFAPFTLHRPRSSLAFAAPIVPSIESPSAHIRIARHPSDPGVRDLLYDKGTTTCPCELNISYTEIEKHLQDEGAGADVFVEPLVPNANLRIDIALQRTSDGESWSLEILLANCVPNTLRTAQIPELSGNRARVLIRAVCPHAPSTPVRVWANEPRVRRAAPPIFLGAR